MRNELTSSEKEAISKTFSEVPLVADRPPERNELGDRRLWLDCNGLKAYIRVDEEVFSLPMTKESI